MNPFDPQQTFNKRSYIVPATCPRHPTTVFSPDTQLRLAVDEYKSCTGLRSGLTLILTHGTSFNKELWVPIIQHWLRPNSSLPILKILSIDAANHGASAVLNEKMLQPVTYWPDHSYDILQVLSHFSVPDPVVGIGHSFGGGTMAHAAVIAPDRFLAVILIEPILFQMEKQTYEVARRALGRRDHWQDLKDVMAFFGSSKAMNDWDVEQRKRYAASGTRMIEEGSKKYRTLTTPKAQEAATYLAAPFPEILPLLSKSMLQLHFVLGQRSIVLDSQCHETLREISKGKGETHFIEDAGHLIPMTHPRQLGNLLESLLLKTGQHMRALL